MNKHHLTKLIAAGLMVLSFSSVCAEDKVSTWLEALEEQLFQSQQFAQGGQERIVKTTWQIYDTKTFSRRKVTVQVPWGKPKAVETVCEAITPDDGKLYVSETCYYPVQDNDQQRVWRGNKLITQTAEISMDKPVEKHGGFVVFDLPIWPQDTPSNLDCGA